MKRKPKKADYRQVEPWLNNKRKNKAFKRKQEKEAEARFIERVSRMTGW